LKSNGLFVSPHDIWDALKQIKEHRELLFAILVGTVEYRKGTTPQQSHRCDIVRPRGGFDKAFPRMIVRLRLLFFGAVLGSFAGSM